MQLNEKRYHYAVVVQPGNRQISPEGSVHRKRQNGDNELCGYDNEYFSLQNDSTPTQLGDDSENVVI